MKILRNMSLVLFMAFCHIAFGQDAVAEEHYSLNIHLKSGDSFGIAFSQKPTIKMDGTFVIFSSDIASAEYPASAIDHFTVDKGDIYTLIHFIPKDEESISWQDERQNILLVNGNPGQLVQILSIDGTTVATQNIGKDRRLLLSFDSYPAGIYIVSTGKSSFKIIRK